MIEPVKIAAVVFLTAALSACMPQSDPYATIPSPDASEQPVSRASDYRVAQINVVVPSTLSVSESNGIKPAADIVWHGDPPGDRYEQVKAVMEAGIRRGAQRVEGRQPVILDVQMVRFHAQTERVRYSSLPSEHEIEFLLTIRDAATGEVLMPAHMVDATFRALGGDAALAADRAGITQKQRIWAYLSEVIAAELT